MHMKTEFIFQKEEQHMAHSSGLCFLPLLPASSILGFSVVLEYDLKGEWLKGVSSALVELAHKLDPVER